jgi:hypothetical protein
VNILNQKTKTLSQLNKELSQLYNMLRPKEYNPKWVDIPKNRKKIDELLHHKKYIEVRKR